MTLTTSFGVRGKIYVLIKLSSRPSFSSFAHAAEASCICVHGTNDCIRKVKWGLGESFRY